MAKYIVDSASLTPIADETRTIDGVTSGLSLEAIASKLNSANREIGSQVNLISQIKELLDGKAGGGGGVASGTFTVAENGLNAPNIELVHNLGKYPTAVVIYAESRANGVNATEYGGIVYFATVDFCRVVRQTTSNNTSASFNSFSSDAYKIGDSKTPANENTFTFNIASSVFALIATDTYRWFIA